MRARRWESTTPLCVMPEKCGMQKWKPPGQKARVVDSPLCNMTERSIKKKHGVMTTYPSAPSRPHLISIFHASYHAVDLPIPFISVYYGALQA